MNKGFFRKAVTITGTIMGVGLLTIGSAFLNKEARGLSENFTNEMKRAAMHAWENRKEK